MDDFELISAPGHLVRRLAQVHNALFADEVHDPRLTSPQFAVVHVLAHRPGIDQITLSIEAGIDRSTTADLVSRLARRGILVRTRSHIDARRNLVRLTPAGHVLHARLLPDVEQVGRRLLGPLSTEERRLLIALMQRLVYADEADQAEGEGGPVTGVARAG